MFDKVNAVYRNGLDLYPTDPSLCLNAVNFQYRQKNFEYASKLYRLAIKLQKENGIAHFNLGNSLLELGHYQDSKKSFLTPIQLNPLFFEAKVNLAGVLRLLGE